MITLVANRNPRATRPWLWDLLLVVITVSPWVVFVWLFGPAGNRRKSPRTVTARNPIFSCLNHVRGTMKTRLWGTFGNLPGGWYRRFGLCFPNSVKRTPKNHEVSILVVSCALQDAASVAS